MSTQPQAAFSPSPTQIFESFNAYHRSFALKAAIELDLFSAIAEGNTTATAIATRIGASERGTRILCDGLVTYGLLQKSAQGYSNTPDGAFFLDRKSEAYIGSIMGFLLHPEHFRAWDKLADAVRKGGSALPGGGNMKMENEIWVDFAKGMAPMMMPAAQKIAQLTQTSGAMKVLDIAAGHGIFGITIAQSNPQAQVFALDWANVLEVAKQHASMFGVAERYHTIPGSLFETEFGDGYDAVLLTNILHHFDRATCVKAIKKGKAALKPGGKVVTLEFVPNDDRVTPATAAEFSLTMLAGTDAGDAYTFAELQGMFAEAGLGTTTRHEVVPGNPQTILVSQ